MVQLFKRMFRQKELQQAQHPPSQQQYDDNYIIYCIEQEQAIDKLESALHTSDNPEEIAIHTLKTACDFYGADWAGIIELDLDLGLTTAGWWYNADPSITRLNRMNEFENLSPMQTWLDSIKNGNPVIIENVDSVAKTSPQEYPVYKRLDVQSLLAVPFGPNPLGFLVLRNPSKYIRLASTLNTLAYVMHRAMAQRDNLNRRSMALAPEEIKTDKDIVINFLGSIEICTKIGVWKEQDFHSPKSCRAAVYVMLHGKSAHSALAIADALATEDTSDVDTINKNIRAYMYRFRKSFDIISKHKLIEYGPNGYSRVKFGHQQAIKQSVVLGNSRLFGYRKDNKRLVIDEEQAVMVRELFTLYATDNYSMKQIETIFWNKGYRNLNGKKIAHSTMSNMIANPKYKGYYVGNKVKVVDMFTKKQKFLPPEEWVMFKDETGEIVPAIVSEELWEEANAVLRRRSEDVKNRQGVCNHANLLTGKLFCTHCGMPYYRRESKDKYGNKNSKWVCSGKINNGKDSCASFPIYEEEIKPLLFEVFRDTKDISAAMLEEYERMYKVMTSDGNLVKKIEDAEAKLQLSLKKKSKLLELVALDSITATDFKTMTASCNEEIKSLESELAELQQQQESSGEFRTHMEKIRSVLRAAEADANKGTITKDFIDTFIDKVYVTPEEDGSMCLSIKIFTGDTTEKYLKKLKRRAGIITTQVDHSGENTDTARSSDDGSRTGHTFKKMIEAQERQMGGQSR